MGDITGTTFAGYEVHDVIGTDLVSVLHRATEPDEDRTVALRVIAQDLCEVQGPDRDLYRRFRREATASLSFEHPFSPTVEEVGEHHGRAYLVAPFIDTIPLSQFVRDHAPLPLDLALELFEGLADVLDSGQDSGLAHGAVNPSTVAFARPTEGTPDAAYLVGYGIGALLELRLKRDRKQLTIVDDLLYVAPEQLRQQPVTGRTDQYALACALVHVLTGEPPFVRDSIGGLFGAHLFVDPELDATHAWADAVRQGMAKDPEERFETCGDLIAKIKAEAGPAPTRVILAPTVSVNVPGSAPPARATDSARPRAPESAPPPRAPEPVPPARAPEPAPPPRAPDGGRGRPEPIRSDEPAPTPRRVSVDTDDDDRRVFARSTPPESRNGARPMSFDGDDVPLLSEVLSQSHAKRRRRPRPGAALLVLLTAIVVVVVVWLVFL